MYVYMNAWCMYVRIYIKAFTVFNVSINIGFDLRGWSDNQHPWAAQMQTLLQQPQTADSVCPSPVQTLSQIYNMTMTIAPAAAAEMLRWFRLKTRDETDATLSLWCWTHKIYSRWWDDVGKQCVSRWRDGGVAMTPDSWCIRIGAI